MPDLTYRLWTELRRALLDAYDRQGLSELLLFKFNIRLENSFPNEGLEATVFRLLDKANREQWLVDLVAATALNRPKNASLQTVLKDLNSMLTDGASQGDDQPPIKSPTLQPSVTLESMLYEQRLRELSQKSLAGHMKRITIRDAPDLAPFHEIFRLVIDSGAGFSTSTNIVWDMAQFVSESYSSYPLRIDGPPGTGKTTLLNLLYLTLQARRDTGSCELIPVLLDCRRYFNAIDNPLQQDIELLKIVLRAAPGSQMVVLIDGVDEYVPATDKSERSLFEFLSTEASTQKLVGVGIRYGNHYPVAKIPVIELGEEERRIVLNGVRMNSVEEKKFLEAFFSLPCNKSDPSSQQRVKSKLPSFRLEQVDLMTISLLTNKLKLPKYRSISNLTEFYDVYCVDWMASKSQDKSDPIEVNRAAEVAFDYGVRGLKPSDVDFAQDPRWRLIHSHETIKDYLIAHHVANSINHISVEPGDLQRLDYVYPKSISRFFAEMMRRGDFTPARLLDKTEEIFRGIAENRFPGRYTKLRSVLCFMLGRLKDEQVIPLALDFLKEWIPKVAAEIEEERSSSTVDKKKWANSRRQNMLLQRTMYVSRIYLKEESASDEYIEKLLNDHAWCSLNRGFHLEYYGDIPYEPREYMLHYDDLKQWACTYHYLYTKARITLEKNAGYEDLVLYTLFSLAQHRHARAPIDEDKRRALLDLGTLALKGARVNSVKLQAYLKMILHNLKSPAFPPAKALEQMYHLKIEPRNGWRKRGLKHPESIADHTYGACLLCITMLPDEPKEDWEVYDKQRVFALLFAHDFIEAYTGDFLPEQKSVKTERLEKRAIDYVEMLATYPEISGTSKLASLWLEFRNNATEDAKVAHDIDKLENLVQLFMLRSGKAASPMFSLDSLDTTDLASQSGITGGAILADFEDFRVDLLNKIQTAPGQYLRQQIMIAFDSDPQ
jgi:5'-deoxynucleotidase YfbR-like HD superfamily hydrolase